MKKIDNGGHRQRMRRRFFEEGLDHFSQQDVLEMLLCQVIPRADTKPIAKRLLSAFGSLPSALEAHPEELKRVEGMGETSAAFLTMIPQLCRYYFSSRWEGLIRLTNRSVAGSYLCDRLCGYTQEVVLLLCLDGQSRVIYCGAVQKGTVESVALQPRQIVEAALLHRARSVILAHNHPGGSLETSFADMALTKDIAEALSKVSVRLLDHFVVAGDSYRTIAQKSGLLGEPECAYQTDPDYK